MTSDTTSTLHFLPWLRRGLATSLIQPDPGTGELPRQAAIPAWLEIAGEDERIEAPLALRPADHATAISTSQIVRRFPAPNATDTEYGYFPLLDVLAPDLPWLLTPAAPDVGQGGGQPSGRLRPWLVLVCVEASEAQYLAATPGDAAHLVVPVDRLPDLAESHAWAHVQSAVAPDAVPDEVESVAGTVIARFVCPRMLAPNTAYRVALVNAFVATGVGLAPAWTSDDDDVSLVAYDTWTFTTGDAHSFEELCERLGPVDDPALVFGLHTTDVTDLGPIDPWPPEIDQVSVDYRGALWDAEVDPDILRGLADDFAAPLRAMLSRADLHPTIDPDDPDPVVAPPFYGAFATEAERVPLVGWMSVLNLAPAPRMAAGRGADVVRRNQERFMARAWEQAGQVREANRQLSLTRLQGEIGATWKGRTDRLTPLQQVAVVRPQLTFAGGVQGGQTPRRALEISRFPNALVSPAFARVTRPSGVAAHAARRRDDRRLSWTASIGPTFGDPDTRSEVAFAIPARPAGTRLADLRHHGPADDPIITPVLADDYDLAETARIATASIAPIAAGTARLVARIPAMADLVAAETADTPTRAEIVPVVDEALMWSLVDIAPELLLPGVEDFPNNAVRVVETNKAYVASFMAGANHEMARELLWREYPADLTGTTFRRFWERADPSAVDITPIADWPRTDGLDELGAASSDSIVLIVRGDLLRHYPNVRVLLVDPSGVGALPSFDGWIPPDIRFIGFDVDGADVVTSPTSAWQIAFEELPTEPRFGLDSVAPGTDVPDLDSWDELAWQHLTGHDTAVHLAIGDDFPSDLSAPVGAMWGLNSAHMARVTYQRPYRRLFPVQQIIGGIDG